MTEKQQELVTKNIGLIGLIIKKYKFKYDYDELFEVGMIGLCKGAKVFDANKGYKPTAILSSCIRNEILMFLRKNKRRKGEISFEDALNYDADGNELHLEDILGTDNDIVIKEFEDKLDKQVLSKHLNDLDEREKQIMILRYGLNNTKEYTQKEVAEILGISQSYISRIEKKVIARLQSILKV